MKILSRLFFLTFEKRLKILTIRGQQIENNYNKFTKKKKRNLTDVMLTQGVSLRTNLNIDSTKLAGVDSSHFSSDLTTHICNKSMSLKKKVVFKTEYFC